MIEKIKDNYNSWALQYDDNINPARDLDKIYIDKVYIIFSK